VTCIYTDFAQMQIFSSISKIKSLYSKYEIGIVMNTLIQDQLRRLSTLDGISQDTALRIVKTVYGIKALDEMVNYRLPSGNRPESLHKSARIDLDSISPYHEILRLQILFDAHHESIYYGLSGSPVMPMLFGYNSFDDIARSSLEGVDVANFDKKSLYESVMGVTHPVDILTGGPLFIFADEDRLDSVLSTLEKINSPYRRGDIRHEAGRIYSFFNDSHPLRAPVSWLITPTKSKSHSIDETKMLAPISQTTAFAMGDGQNLATDNMNVMHVLKMGKTYSYSI